MRRWRRRGGAGGDGGDLTAAAEHMVETQLVRRGIRDPRVLEAMRRVPRHRFVPRSSAGAAYSDNALPIAQGQTISQPFIVALMTEALALGAWRDAHDGAVPRVLDVGTGSGYQAAVLAELGAEVVSIERRPDLAGAAERLLNELGYAVRVIVGDGSRGWPSSAPYAGILVAAASPAVPVPLVEQLTPDGRLVIPIGTRVEQRLVVVQPAEDGFSSKTLEAAVFVPLVGEFGWREE